MEELERKDVSRKENVGTAGYEYKEVETDRESVSFYMDSYRSFGWIKDKNISVPSSGGKVSLAFKRDRRLANKTELTRLQRNFEACIDEIEAMKKSIFSRANTTAMLVACVGTALIAAAVFMVSAETPHIMLCAVLGVPGILGLILPIRIYRKLVKDRTRKLSPFIEEKYEEMRRLCEKGERLLYDGIHVEMPN